MSIDRTIGGRGLQPQSKRERNWSLRGTGARGTEWKEHPVSSASRKPPPWKRVAETRPP